MKKKPTGGTIFSGFEGCGIGMKAAGINVLWGIELNDAIAQVARNNGFNVITADVCQIDPATLEPVDNLHFSPPCITASAANQSAEVNEDGLKETPLDMALANAVVRFVTALQPKVVTLENVYGYRNYQSFRGGDKFEGIVPALRRMGYFVDWWHLNAADYGVPQSRRRLILIARKDKQPRKPVPTHRNPADATDGQLSLFEQLPVWNGWYSAIADIVDTLPESKFAAWQLKRLPDQLKETLIVDCNHTGLEQSWNGKGIRYALEPIGAVPAQPAGGLPRAFLVDSSNTGREATLLEGDDTAATIQAWHGRRPSQMPRAYIVEGRNGTGGSDRYDNEPAQSVTQSHPPRAYLVGDQQEQLATDEQPSNTIRAYSGGGMPPRALMPSGRVVKMSVRALARFQTVPDWYILPDNNALACRGIGNAVPPLLAQRIYEGLLD
jgi:DNA (cytosine-5)-methyltransferase 1